MGAANCLQLLLTPACDRHSPCLRPPLSLSGVETKAITEIYGEYRWVTACIAVVMPCSNVMCWFMSLHVIRTCIKITSSLLKTTFSEIDIRGTALMLLPPSLPLLPAAAGLARPRSALRCASPASCPRRWAVQRARSPSLTQVQPKP